MNKLLLTALIGVTVLVSCKEKAPSINFGTNNSTGDTTYTASPETPQDHIVLIEEFTGASCSNCPAAHEALKSLSSQNPNRIISMAIHIYNFPQSNPRSGATYDFRDSVGTDIGGDIYGGIGQMPIAGIDRMPLGTSTTPLLVNTNKWASSIATQLAVDNPVNVYVTSNYDAIASIATIKVKLAYTTNVAAAHNISIAILQDSLIDKQEYPDHDDDAYEFNSIFRGLITSEYGDPVEGGNNMKAGTVYIRTYKYAVLPGKVWDPKNARVVAFVNSDPTSGSKKIYQSAQCKLAGE